MCKHTKQNESGISLRFNEKHNERDVKTKSNPFVISGVVKKYDIKIIFVDCALKAEVCTASDTYW
jgi:hypothetical protein